MGKVSKKFLVGSTWEGKYGNFSILEYVGKSNTLSITRAKIKVKFEATGFVKWTDTKGVTGGTVKDPFFPNVMGIGYKGLADSSDSNGKVKSSYHRWYDMLDRCYTKEGLAYNPTYIDCYVCEEWLCYANYEKWFDFNYKEDCEVDKDFKVVGNKVYSPETCVFIPQRINCLIGKKKVKGKTLPTGVSYHTRDKVYNSKCWDGTRLVHLGDFYCPDEAREAYIDYKTNLIRSIVIVAYEEGTINKTVYDNLYNWKV